MSIEHFIGIVTVERPGAGLAFSSTPGIRCPIRHDRPHGVPCRIGSGGHRHDHAGGAADLRCRPGDGPAARGGLNLRASVHIATGGGRIFW